MSPTIIDGDLSVPDFIRIAAERSLEIKLVSDVNDDLETPLGSGQAFVYEVQRGLRCELGAITWSHDRELEFLGGPLISASLLLEGSMEPSEIDNLGIINSSLHKTRIIGLSEPTRWIRPVKAGQYCKMLGVIMEPEFFDRFSDVVPDEQLILLNKFHKGQHSLELPCSQRLLKLGNDAFEHSYAGALAEIYQESNTLQFVLELVSLLSEEEQIIQGIGRAHYDKLMHARAILDDDLINPPKTLDLAKQVGGNVSTLQAHFKQAFGTTIFGYISKRRLEMARVLLTEFNLGSAQVGYRVGFSNPAAFTAAYRKYYGYPPSKER